MFCQSQAYPTENKPEKARFFWVFLFRKKPKVLKKSQNYKIRLQKSQIGNPATQKLRMRIKYARKRYIFCYVQKSR